MLIRFTVFGSRGSIAKLPFPPLFFLLDISSFYVKQLVVVTDVLQNLVEMVAIGVGYEYLTETVTRHQLYDTLHTVGVQLVEDVVKEQERSGLR